MSENPNDWRSTIDPTSGRTYWYHRKTRISTWVKPDFIEIKTSVNDINPISSSTERNNIVSTPNITKQITENLSLKSLMEKIANNPSESISNDLNKILNHLMTNISYTIDNANEIISNLIGIITQTKSTVSRQVTLRALCILTQNHYLTSEQFGINQSWGILIKFVNIWSDIESSLLLAASYCNLMIGTTYSLITEEMKFILINRIKDLSEKKDLNLNLDLFTYYLFDGSNLIENTFRKQSQIKLGVLNELTVQSYLILGEKGHTLPVVWLLALFNQFTKSDKLFAQIIEMGYVQVMHLICINSKVSETWKGIAKSLLLVAMSCSPTVQESVLDAFIDFSKSLSEIAVPIGPEPILYESTSFMLNMNKFHPPIYQQTITDNISINNGHKIVENYFEDCLENGHCDVIDSASSTIEIHTENWELLNRDIEWIPISGTRWRLSSVLIWARCPALRELINEFWETGGGGLELSIEACDQVLACICRYIHTGYLIPPITVNQQLELLRVSSELGMDSLHCSVSKILLQQLTMQSVSTIIEFCALNGYSSLEQSCRSYLATGLKQSAIKFSNSKSLNLRDAVFASLQDVNEVLSEGNSIIYNNKAATKNDVAIISKDEDRLKHGVNHKIDLNQKEKEYSSNVDASLLDIAAGLADNDFMTDGFDYNFENNNFEPDKNNSSNIYSQSKTSKTKSGEIYGMLLRENILEDDGQNKQTLSRSATKIPGRVMDNKSMSTNLIGKKSKNDFKNSSFEKIEASDFLTKYNRESITASSEFTPKTKRASNLLANARPSGYSYDDNVENNQFSYFDNSIASANDVPQEFIKPMSLAPTRELTEAEKKLERLTRPTKAIGTKYKLPNKNAINDEDESSNQKCLSNDKAEFTSNVSDIQPTTSLVELKRSVSPPTPTSSRDGRVALGLVSAPHNHADLSMNDGHGHNVRGSLTLLKTKTASRRRRSVADIEADNIQNKQECGQESYDVSVNVTANVVLETPNENKSIIHLEDNVVLNDNTEYNANDNEDLLQCPDCSRRFKCEPYQKHIKVCAQVFMKKRAAFDSTKMRVQANPDLLNFLEGSENNNSKKKSSKNITNNKVINGKTTITQDNTFKKNWKEESNAFREAMKAARQVTAALASGAPLPPPTLSAPDPSLIPCPHCLRRFNAKAAERHIPQCQNIIAKPSSLKRGAGLNASKGLNNVITPAKSRSWQ